MAKTFIDATGDGDVAFKAGVPFEKGDKQGKMQGVSLEFVVAGIDKKGYDSWLKKYPDNKLKNILIKKAERSGELRSSRDTEHRIMADVIHSDSVRGFNYGHTFNADGTNTEDLTRVMINGRRLAAEFIKFAKKHISGMKNAMLVATGALPGVRETRRFKGAYKLTLDDFSSMRQFKDQIAVYDYPVDVHSTVKSQKAEEDSVSTMEKYVLPRGRTYGIPFSSMKPAGIDNLLLAGRNISVDRMAHGSTRVMPACMAIGEAAGLAAAMAAKKGRDFTSTNIKQLQNSLRKQGAKIE